MKETVEIYRGFVIRSYEIGRSGNRRNYRCGRERAPTKKLVKEWIDRYLDDPKKYEIELNLLEKENGESL